MIRRAGFCDPLLPMGIDLQAIIPDVANIFPAIRTHIMDQSSSSMDNYDENKIEDWEIIYGKRYLRYSLRGTISIFVGVKSIARYQRKIWHGTELSEVATRSPIPPRLANPSSIFYV